MTEPRPPRTGEHFRTEPPRLFCPEQDCGRLFHLQLLHFLAHFIGSPIACEGCGRRIDLLTAVREAVRRADFLLVQLAGAYQSAFSLILDPGETVVVNLHDLGIPDDARILSIAHSESRGFRPIIMSDGSRSPRPRAEGVYELHAFPDDSCEAEAHDTVVLVVWVPAAIERGEYEPLLDAARGLANQDTSQMAVLAHVAVEMATKRVLKTEAARVAPPGVAAAFTVSPRMAARVVVPLIADRLELPALPEHLVASLSMLKRARDEAAHEPRELTINQAQEFFVTAVFVVTYLHLVWEAQQGRLTHHTTP